MTLHKSAVLTYWRTPLARRGWLLLLALSVLLVMAFYAVTDSSHLTHNHVLNGADWLSYAICHRITSRSFVVNGPDEVGRQFPLCARCAGMYLGVTLVFVTLWLAGRLRWSGLPPWPILLVLAGFIGIMGIDGLNSYSHFFPNAPHLYEPRNWLRLVTGMGTGLAMGSMTFPALTQTLWREQIDRPVIGTGRELAGLILAAGMVVLLLLSNQPELLYVMALVSTAGILLMVLAINIILLLVLLRRDGRATSWREAAVPLTIGVVLAVVELSTISLLRFNLTGTMIGFPGL